jgi:hypothetical protein
LLRQRIRPILQCKAGNAAELMNVIGHKGDSNIARVGGNQEVVRADHVPRDFESGSYLAIMESGFVRIIEHNDMLQVGIERGAGLL